MVSAPQTKHSTEVKPTAETKPVTEDRLAEPNLQAHNPVEAKMLQKNRPQLNQGSKPLATIFTSCETQTETNIIAPA